MANKSPLLLHFSQIQDFSEHQYLELMQDALADTSRLAQMATQDLYYLSTYVLSRKFFWLKISYALFFCGYLIALAAIGLNVL